MFKPILFSTPMVQAILEGRKTMTRRVVSNQNSSTTTNFFKLDFNDVVVEFSYLKAFQREDGTRHRVFPKYEVGDVLWVREKSCYVMLEHAHDLLEGCKDNNQTVYATSVHEDWMIYAKEKYGYKWKPSIFMPKNACRIFLEVTDVYVERLQDISNLDAIKEGIVLSKYDAAIQFSVLWKSINGQQSWNDNPFVWVVSFKRIDKPENFK